MTTGATSSTGPLPGWAHPDAEPRRRRRGWGWLIALVIVAGLVVAAWFLGEWIARDLVVKTIREQVITQLALPADQDVDVTVEGTVIPQLIAGRLDDVTIASDDVMLGEAFTGDVTVHATGLTFRGDPSAQSASARVVLDTAQVQALMATVKGFPADTLGLHEPNVTMSTTLTFFGATFPIGVGLTPSADQGELVLSPALLQLGDAKISAEDLRDRFGPLADAVLRDWTVCIAQYLPAAVTVTDTVVAGGKLTADLTIDPRVISDAALQRNGTCS